MPIKQIPVKAGFMYRGPTRVITLESGHKIKLVQHETYVIAKIKPDSVDIVLKKPGKKLAVVITRGEYGKYLVPGRSSFKDEDPYK